ncbi:hypothetical protein [Nocardia veterana]|uniref:Uncharacterized protein n=1 Tax=Nocardia veterana TaxID=132249 RepID=A0A7X6M3V9_9NOCA|nr:hypothetical protein [Nocardia veterana]NKY88855.1 hypothetical protein [Nocardia veterana]
MTLKKAVAAATFGLAIAALGAGAANAAVTTGGVHTGVDPESGAWDGYGERPPYLEGHSVPAPAIQPGVTTPYDPNNVDSSGQLPNGGDGY